AVLLARHAIEQGILDEANDQRAGALAERQFAEAALKLEEIRLRSTQAELSDARTLLDTVSEPGPDTPQRREAVLRLHNETALRRAQADFDVTAAELSRAKASLEGAVANHDFREKQAIRLRQLAKNHAVEEQLAEQAEGQESLALAKVHSAQASVAEAEAKLKAAEEKLRDLKREEHVKRLDQVKKQYEDLREKTKKRLFEQVRDRSEHHD
ncbi:MAG: hypothetical protein ACP5XB_29130, partial [Isosphaeraceae bacterium]